MTTLMMTAPSSLADSGGGAPLGTPAAPPHELAALSQACRAAALRAAAWIEGQLDPTASFGPDAQDLAAYYKAPLPMHLIGRPRLAYRLLDYIVATFGTANGDVQTAPSLKTADPVLAQYPGYLNGWIILGAHRSGRFDISYPSWAFLRRFQHPTLGAGLLDHPWYNGTPSQLELLMTAHLGLIALYLGDPAAAAAGQALLDFYALQPQPEQRLYLRRAASGPLIQAFPAEAAGLYVVEAKQTGQAWFFVGYPSAFLTYLYWATGNPSYLQGAQHYANFALPPLSGYMSPRGDQILVKVVSQMS